MAKMYKRLIYLMIAGLALVNCAGEDGDPGPAGEQGTAGEKGDQGEKGDAGLDAVVKLGTLEGKFTGIRRDGTAFEYPFTYEYTYANGNSFRNLQGKSVVTIDRKTIAPFEDYAGFDLEKINGTLVPANSMYSASFEFHKELTATTLFELSASASFENFAGEFRPISKTNNERYQFSSNGKYIYPTTYNSQNVYFINGYNLGVYYNQTTGALLTVYDFNSDAYLTSGALFDKFNEVKLTLDTNLGQFKFIDKATGASLHEVIPAVPSDKLSITNYSHNATTGILSFDFKLEISKYEVAGRTNSTNHDLVIEGKYNSGSKVYESTVGRTKN